MTTAELLDLLGKAFADGKIDHFAPYMADDCEYSSDYANKSMSGSEAIIKRMKEVHSNVDDSCRYSYKIIELSEFLADGRTLESFNNIPGIHIVEKGLLLFQYGEKPVAVVCVMADDNTGLVKSIILSRKKILFSVNFFREELECADSPKDIPSTVTPLTPHDRQVKELRRAFSGQNLPDPEKEQDDNLYIWREADKYIKGWLKDNGYTVLESKIFDDCVGYRCNRRNYAYTVFMYAYGQMKTVLLDGDYCEKLLEYSFSEKSTVLVVYLNVKRYLDGDKVEHRVFNYCGDEDRGPELWQVSYIGNKPILKFYPRKEMMDLIEQLMYAFNHDNADVYDNIISYHNPSFIGPGDSGYAMNGAVVESLCSLHEKYGNMKLGYVRYNDVVYSSAPYIDGYGFFSFRVDNSTDKIISITGYEFDGGERKVAEFVRTEMRESDELYDFVPRAIDVMALSPVLSERFAIKVTYNNGEIKKYVLPIETKYEHDEAVQYHRHVFSDGIWNTAEIVPGGDSSEDSIIRKALGRGPAIRFKNNFFIPVMTCYLDGTDYSEPVECDEEVYNDGHFRLQQKWKWNVNSLNEDVETGLLKVLISGQTFNWYGKSTFASKEGKRLTSLDFDYIDNFHEGLSQVCVAGHGYGFVDKDMKFAIPMQYENADKFQNGKAKVKKEGTWIYIDRTGKETTINPSGTGRYQEVGQYFEGLCKVSTLKLRLMDLAYYSDYEDIAGVWGYVNEKGEEVIQPQYIYANDFSNDLAIVCKGKWTIDKKWDNKYNQGRYWTEEELWGAIDVSGKEVIPFIFDEIKFFFDVDDVFMAHYGGWENGHWGVIDNHGNWLAEPTFEDIGYDYRDGLFTFYAEDRWSDDSLMGIYDVNQKKVIFEPQFQDVSFRKDGYIEVEVFDKELDRTVKRIIDVNGKEKFHSIYSSIYGGKNPYEVVIRDSEGTRHGLIDEDGTVILPCKYDVSWNGISYESKRIVFAKDGKQGMMDFDDNVIIEPIYYEIHGMHNPLLTVRVGEKDNYKEGLITPDGVEVLPAVYSDIRWCRDNYIICCQDGNSEVYQLMVSNEA